MTCLRDTARRIAESKGFALEEVEGFFISDDVPNLDNDRDIGEVTAVLGDHQAEFAFFDPAYLMLGDQSASASNVYAMGAMLRRMLRGYREAGATPVVLHHFRKSQPIGEPPDLGDLSQSGCGEFAGEWLLINRERPYDEEQPGEHDLIVCLGSRVGFSSKWALHVSEGSPDSPGGRHWKVKVTPPGEARERDRDLEEARKAIVAAMVKLGEPAGRSEIQPRVRIKASRFSPAWFSLVDDASVVEAGTVRKGNNQSYPAYRVEDNADG